MTKCLDGLMDWDLKISLSNTQIAVGCIISGTVLAYTFQESFVYTTGYITNFFSNETELS